MKRIFDRQLRVQQAINVQEVKKEPAKKESLKGKEREKEKRGI